MGSGSGTSTISKRAPEESSLHLPQSPSKKPRRETAPPEGIGESIADGNDEASKQKSAEEEQEGMRHTADVLSEERKPDDREQSEAQPGKTSVADI